MGTAKTTLQLAAKMQGQCALTIAVVQLSLANVLCFYFQFPLIRSGFCGNGENWPPVSCENARSMCTVFAVVQFSLAKVPCFYFEFGLIRRGFHGTGENCPPVSCENAKSMRAENRCAAIFASQCALFLF